MYSYDRRTAVEKTLDLAWVEGLRRDFLTLFKNVDRVRSYRDLDEFRQAVNMFRQNFDHIVFDRFLNKDVQNAKWRKETWASWVEQKLRSPAWAFSSDMSVPAGYPENAWWTEERCLARFQQEAPKWKARVQRHARAFWTAMKDVIEWFQGRDTPSGGPKTTVPEQYQTTLEGFRVVLIGYDEGYEPEQTLAKFKEGLKLYRERASKVAPVLIKHQVPILVEFEASVDKGGEYLTKGVIKFYASSVSAKSHKWVTHVMAHEMGHHLWRTYLGGDAQTFWAQTIKGDLGDIDLKELLDKWPGDAWAFDFPNKMPDDPLMALQVDAFTHASREHANIQQKSDYQALYDKGERTLRVPKTPITGYANKNPEEAFCEAMGLLVAYGPGALHERVRWWLRTILEGEVRVSKRLN